MIEESRYLELMGKIVAGLLPQERQFFELAGKKAADKLYQTGEITSRQTGQPDEFLFIEEAKAALEFASLMAGTFKTIYELYELSKQGHLFSKGEACLKWLNT